LSPRQKVENQALAAKKKKKFWGTFYHIRTVSEEEQTTGSQPPKGTRGKKKGKTFSWVHTRTLDILHLKQDTGTSGWSWRQLWGTKTRTTFAKTPGVSWGSVLLRTEGPGQTWRQLHVAEGRSGACPNCFNVIKRMILAGLTEKDEITEGEKKN